MGRGARRERFVRASRLGRSRQQHRAGRRRYVRPGKKEIPAWTPPAAAFVATAPPRPGHAVVPEDRRRFDGRRVGAYFIDALLIGLIPAILQVTSIVTDGALLVSSRSSSSTTSSAR